MEPIYGNMTQTERDDIANKIFELEILQEIESFTQERETEIRSLKAKIE